MVSSVWIEGVADSVRLYVKSPRMIAIPRLGKNPRRRPPMVIRRMNRLARDVDGPTGGVPAGHMDQASNVPPTRMMGMETHSNTVPLGRSIDSATPANVVTRAASEIVRRNRTRNVANRSKPMTRRFSTHTLDIRRLAACYRPREPSSRSWGTSPTYRAVIDRDLTDDSYIVYPFGAVGCLE